MLFKNTNRTNNKNKLIKLTLIASVVIIGIGIFVNYYFINGVTNFSKIAEKPKVEIPKNIKVDFNLVRIENLLINCNSTTNKELSLNCYRKLFEKEPDFFQTYLTDILQLGDEKNSLNPEEFANFMNDKYIKELFADASSLYPISDSNSLKSDYKKAFIYLKKYFPDYRTPNVYTMISGFAVGNALIGKGDIAVGLDFYLGRNYKYYPKVSYFHNYIRPRLQREYMVPNSMLLVAEDLIGPEPIEAKLLDFMVYYGKKYYLAEKFQPETADSLILGYTSTQMEWCFANENMIWKYILESNLLYSQENHQVRKFINDGPFTPGLPAESPGKIGHFVGYQIVRNFMKNHPELSLKDLAALTNGQEILEKSKYRPK